MNTITTGTAVDNLDETTIGTSETLLKKAVELLAKIEANTRKA